jgi:hypothetical protein
MSAVYNTLETIHKPRTGKESLKIYISKYLASSPSDTSAEEEAAITSQ